mgnify:CR=1 FL=1
MNQADFSTATNGFPLESDATLGFMQSAYTDAANALAKMMGPDMVVVSGMVESGNAVGSGWILLNGELVKFMGGTKSATFIIVDSWEKKANQDGQLYDRYLTRMAQFGTGSVEYNYADLQRSEAIVTLRERIVDLFSLETGVIVKGCEVSGVTSTNLNISAGVAIINRKMIAVGSYSGTFPVYLKEDGTFVTAAPSAANVEFLPHTSRRWADVLRRALTPVGNVSMYASLPSDRFDTSGAGKFEWKGYALCNGANGTVNLNGRFPVGRYLNGNSLDTNWDSAYGVAGSTGGEKEVALTIANLPSHNHTGNTSNGGPVGQGEYGLVKRSQSGQSVTSASQDASGSGTEPDVAGAPNDIPFQGDNTKHENRPPFLVLAFVQRIN